MVSCKEANTILGSAEAAQLFILLVEIVIVSQLFPSCYMSLCQDNDMLLAVHSDDLCCAVGVATVVQVASLTSKECRIDDVLLVESEHVAVADALVLVSLLSLVCNLVTDYLAHVLDHNIFWLEIFQGEKANPVNFTRPHFNLLRVLERASVLHGDGQIDLV